MGHEARHVLEVHALVGAVLRGECSGAVGGHPMVLHAQRDRRFDRHHGLAARLDRRPHHNVHYEKCCEQRVLRPRHTTRRQAEANMLRPDGGVFKNVGTTDGC